MTVRWPSRSILEMMDGNYLPITAQMILPGVGCEHTATQAPAPRTQLSEVCMYMSEDA